jgi:hypothetical protein
MGMEKTKRSERHVVGWEKQREKAEMKDEAMK